MKNIFLKLYKQQIITLFISALVLVLMISCDKCDRIDSANPFAKAECCISELMEDINIASYQVAVAKDGKIIYEKAFGVANLKERIPTTTETMYLVASIDKPFVSTALMILAERGRIDLHAPANDYLGDSKLIAYRGDAKDATVARLLLHTSGLPYGYYIAGDEIPQNQKRTDRDLTDLAGVLVTAPGTKYQYTNLGYGLFDDIVNQAAGENIKSFITKEIITPLKLERTRFFDSEPPLESIATQNVPEGVLPITFDSDGYTALYSTASDLVRFGMFQLKSYGKSQPPILSDSSLDMMWQFKEPELKITTRRLAWDVQKDFGLVTVQHGGGGPGIHNWLYMIPSENIVIAILSNARYSSPKSKPVLVELIRAAIIGNHDNDFSPRAGRSWPRWPKLDPSDFSGEWSGHIRGPKGVCAVSLKFDSDGIPSMLIEGDSCYQGQWVKPSGDVGKSYGSLLWRFDACIPYLSQYAIHDEVILTIWPEGNQLIGHAAAAKEKNFGRGENYVLPQFIELIRSTDK